MLPSGRSTRTKRLVKSDTPATEANSSQQFFSALLAIILLLVGLSVFASNCAKIHFSCTLL
jgi:hypothetical protein